MNVGFREVQLGHLCKLGSDQFPLRASNLGAMRLDQHRLDLQHAGRMHSLLCGFHELVQGAKACLEDIIGFLQGRHLDQIFVLLVEITGASDGLPRWMQGNGNDPCKRCRLRYWIPSPYEQDCNTIGHHAPALVVSMSCRCLAMVYSIHGIIHRAMSPTMTIGL